MRLWRNPAPRPQSAGSLTPGGGKAGLARFQQGAAREYFDVPGLICGLNGENLHDFAEMRVKLRYESAGYDQSGGFIFDEIRHELHDGVFNIAG